MNSPFRYEYHKLKCSKCGRKILVELTTFGIPHHFGVAATCAECLKISEEFRKARLQEAQDIESWIKEEDA